jgi:signal transduction histidine kinase
VTKRWLDVFVVLLFVAAVLSAAVTDTDGSRLALFVLPLGWTLPLLARHRFPVASILVVLGSLALEARLAQEGTTTLIALLAVLLAFALAGQLEPRTAVLTAAVGAVGISVVMSSNPGGPDAGDLFFGLIVVLLPFGASFVVAQRERHAARLRASRAAAAIEEERARIARDLHDVVGHALTVMTVQAGAARLRLEPEDHPVLEQVEAIEETGREALLEMRRLVGVLRDGDAPRGPQPGLAALPPLLERLRSVGTSVELTITGEQGPLSPGVDLAAYRVVQEALTNVSKHAGPATATVTLTYGGDALSVEVSDDGAGVPVDGSGHGLVGMRERVALYGGSLVAGPRPEGGFSVRATLPRGPA